MDPREWGRGFWLIIWIILYNNNIFSDLTEVKQYIDVITRNLPCEMCKTHIVEKLQEKNVMSMTSRGDIINFFIGVYNDTNKSNNTIEFTN